MYGEKIDDVAKEIKNQNILIVVVVLKRCLEQFMKNLTITYQFQINHIQKLVHWR